MQSSTEENKNGNGSCSGNPVQPCACCAALAQLRMPWMDVAVQHAAPHYPVANPYGAQPYPYPYPGSHAQAQGQAAARAEAQENEPYEEPEKKTLFFKLPGSGKKKDKKRYPKILQNLASAAGASTSNSSDARQKHNANDDAAADRDTEASDASADGDAAESSSEAGKKEHDSDWQAEGIKPKSKIKLAFGIKGIAVSLFGIFLPAFVLTCSILSTPKRITLVSLHHPAETFVEFMLVAGIPLINYLVWSAICKNKATLSRWLVMSLGASIGTGLVLAGICFAAMFGSHEGLADAIGSDFTMGFAWLSMLSLLSALVSSYLTSRLVRSWETQSSRMKVAIQAATGVVLSLLAFAGSEFRPWSIRLAQYNAVSKDVKVRKEGLTWLRQLNPEREMRMECSDNRAAGLPGLFFPIKSADQQQLYFTMTGTPYSFRDEKASDLASMSNDYLTRHVVGDKIPHFGLTRSSLSGVLHANTLSSSLSWTFVVKNADSNAHELRAEIGLPAGASVTGLTVWRHGEPEVAGIVASGKIEGLSSSITAGNDTPGMVTDLGHGRVLLHCYPVPGEEELKVRLTMVMPMKSETDGMASVITPQLIASNFDLDGEHSVRLLSKTPVSSSAKSLEIGKIPGENTISGNLSTEQLETSPLVITAKREQNSKPYMTLDAIAAQMKFEEDKEKERIRFEAELAKERQLQEENKQDLKQVVLMVDGSRGMSSQLEGFSKILSQQKNVKTKVLKPRVVNKKPQYVTEEISRIAAPAPSQLFVVIDGSASMQEYRKDLAQALAALPAGIPTKVIVASQENEKSVKPVALSSILPNIEKMNFVGGQDNLKSVVNAAELAGETKGAAVLWIHGPQPVLNQEIYIMSPYETAPAFYELPVVAGTDTFEFFKNHSEIGPFSQVPRSGNSITTDLKDFFAKWNPNNNSYVPTIAETEKKPADYIEPSKEEAKELVLLRAAQECERLVSTRHFRRAAKLAVRYGFVSAVSSAYMGNSVNVPQDADDAAQVNASSANSAQSGEEAQSSSATSDNGTSADGFDSNGASTMQGGSAAAPVLQGATNGTIVSQGSDATIIMGVNSAGTVRVNNLANLEALLNIIANLGELGALVAGLGLVAHGFMNKAIVKLGEDVELGPGGRIVIGAILVFAGLALPGILNWFVASARDANLFS